MELARKVESCRRAVPQCLLNKLQRAAHFASAGPHICHTALVKPKFQASYIEKSRNRERDLPNFLAVQLDLEAGLYLIGEFMVGKADTGGCPLIVIRLQDLLSQLSEFAPRFGKDANDIPLQVSAQMGGYRIRKTAPVGFFHPTGKLGLFVADRLHHLTAADLCC